MEAPDSARSPHLLLAYKSAAQHLLSKAGMRVLKLQRSASAAAKDKQRSSPLAQLAELVLQRKRRRRRLPLESAALAPKPRNCRRVVVLGAPRVGKTSLVRRFLREDFEERYEPTREDFHRKLYQIRGEAYQIDMLDPAGEREFPAKRRLTILTGDIFLVVLSLDDRGSFEEARALRSEISRAKSALLRCAADGARVPVVVCANKTDLPAEERAVSHDELLRAFGGKDTACALFETSAKDGGPSLERAFEALAARAGLPVETGPSRHRRVSLRSYRRLGGGGGGRSARKTEAHETPCGALHPLARRPSVSADLRLVLATQGKKRTSKTAKK
ncbi:dexamethasone-induced Ras-related protein 1 [Salminus brasiliensis]|uniref:dexamethasone-induced Ras-related protein 1 n=1 Tax=Salminus brasiliensis TaxID=930266 RepID=UPI003B82E757